MASWGVCACEAMYIANTSHITVRILNLIILFLPVLARSLDIGGLYRWILAFNQLKSAGHPLALLRITYPLIAIMRRIKRRSKREFKRTTQDGVVNQQPRSRSIISGCLPLVSLDFCTDLMTFYAIKDFRNHFGAKKQIVLIIDSRP